MSVNEINKIKFMEKIHRKIFLKKMHLKKLLSKIFTNYFILKRYKFSILKFEFV